MPRNRHLSLPLLVMLTLALLLLGPWQAGAQSVEDPPEEPPPGEDPLPADETEGLLEEVGAYTPQGDVDPGTATTASHGQFYCTVYAGNPTLTGTYSIYGEGASQCSGGYNSHRICVTLQWRTPSGSYQNRPTTCSDYVTGNFVSHKAYASRCPERNTRITWRVRVRGYTYQHGNLYTSASYAGEPRYVDC